MNFDKTECKIYDQNIMGNLNNFDYGITKKHQSELKKEYENIGKLAQYGNQEEKLHPYMGYKQMFNNNLLLDIKKSIN